MKLSAFSVFDAAVGAFLPPFFMRSHLEAVRSFGEAVGNQEHQFAKHPKDYTLFHLGEFDDASGFLSPETAPKPIISAQQAIADNSPKPPNS
jgi:hypothetical protein